MFDGISPFKITDRNGNYITISYHQVSQGPYQGLILAGAISTIQDTLGRVISFSYNYNPSTFWDELVSIKAPPFNGTLLTVR